MTLKDMFKKVEIYNEMAELMQTQKARIYFADLHGSYSYGEHFNDYAGLRKYVRHEYINAIADKVLKSDGFEFDQEYEIENDGRRLTFLVNLVA